MKKNDELQAGGGRGGFTIPFLPLDVYRALQDYRRRHGLTQHQVITIALGSFFELGEERARLTVEEAKEDVLKEKRERDARKAKLAEEEREQERSYRRDRAARDWTPADEP